MQAPTGPFVSRFGLVTPAEVTVRDGEEVVIALGRDRGLTVAFTLEDLDRHTRLPVSGDQAEAAWQLLTTPQPASEELSPAELTAFAEVPVSLDFDATVAHLRRLYASPLSPMPARLVVTVEFEKVLCSELAHCLARPFDELINALRNADKTGAARPRQM